MVQLAPGPAGDASETTRFARRGLPSVTAQLRISALAALLIGLIVAGMRAAFPFEHGIWLVAYLLLVGFAAPLLLALGESKLLAGRAPSGPGAGLQAVLWLIGTVAVPAGVIADTRSLVVVGGLALWLALASMLAATRPRRRSSPPDASPVLAGAYVGLIAFMAGSVVVGFLLADMPWL